MRRRMQKRVEDDIGRKYLFLEINLETESSLHLSPGWVCLSLLLVEKAQTLSDIPGMATIV